MKKILLTLLTVVMSVSYSWGYEETTHQAKSYAANVITDDQDDTWTIAATGTNLSIAASNELPADISGTTKRGVSVAKAADVFTVTSSTSYTDVSKVVVYASANGGCTGNVSVKVGSTTLTAPSTTTLSSGNKNVSFTFTSATPVSGVITITLPYTTTKTVWFGGVVIGTGVPAGVSGVTLDKTSATLTVGDKTTLTATVAPAEAFNKNITWTTDNADVATVSNGVVSAIAQGTATITATTEDGGYTATCDITVNPFIQPTYTTFTFNANSSDADSGTSWSAGSNASNVFSEGAEGVSAITDAVKVYPAKNSLNKGVKFGTSSVVGTITFTLSHTYNVSKVIVTAAPYGDTEGQQGFTLNGTDVAMTNGENKVYADYDVDITGSVSTITLTQKEANKGRIYVRSITLVKNDAPATISIDVNSCGNASFSCDKGLDFTDVDGVKAYMVTDETKESITLTEINKVPANTGIFVVGTGGSYNVPTYYGAVTEATTNNKLTATTTAKEIDGSENIWALSKTDGLLHPVTSGTIAAGKAYLVSTVSAPSPARTLVFDNESTGIQSVQQNAQNSVAYNLAGQRVAANAKGIVIMNGKKYLNK